MKSKVVQYRRFKKIFALLDHLGTTQIQAYPSVLQTNWLPAKSQDISLKCFWVVPQLGEQVDTTKTRAPHTALLFIDSKYSNQRGRGSIIFTITYLSFLTMSKLTIS